MNTLAPVSPLPLHPLYFSKGVTVNRYTITAAIYFVAALLLFINAPAPPTVLAQSGSPCDAETPCQSGEKCCHGTCIPSGDVCCENGTHGDGEECACCTGCVDDNCSTVSTVVCIDDVEGYGE